MLSFLLRASFFIAAGDSATIAPFLFFYLGMNISTLCRQKLYKQDSSHGSNQAAVMSLLFTIFVTNKHNRFRNCQPEIAVSVRTNQKIYLTIIQDRGKPII